MGEAIAASQCYWEQQLEETVAEARAQGARWEDIGNALGMSKQAAHERFARPHATGTPFAGVLKTVDNIEAALASLREARYSG